MAQSPLESHWPLIKSLAEKGDQSQLLKHITDTPDSKERVELFRFAIRCLMYREWTNKNLSPIVDLGDAVINHALDLSKGPDGAHFREQANIMCFNMSANVADCWDNGFIRTTVHFEKGLRWADQALELRRELKKGPDPLSMAFWARGMHLMSLGRLPEAQGEFLKSLDYAQVTAAEMEAEKEVSPKAPFLVLLGFGYLALVQIAQGLKEGSMVFEQVMDAFNGMAQLSAEGKDDAAIGVAQLQYVRAKLISKVSPPA
ncbi:MAG: hypothetical protein V4736_07550 [Bdellovibrionota bacterium]